MSMKEAIITGAVAGAVAGLVVKILGWIGAKIEAQYKKGRELQEFRIGKLSETIKLINAIIELKFLFGEGLISGSKRDITDLDLPFLRKKQKQIPNLYMRTLVHNALWYQEQAKRSWWRQRKGRPPPFHST